MYMSLCSELLRSTSNRENRKSFVYLFTQEYWLSASWFYLACFGFLFFIIAEDI